MPAFSVLGVKEQAVSADGAEVKLTFASKFLGDMEISMPADGVDELIAKLHQVKAARRAKNPKSPDQVQVTVPKKWLVTADVKTRGLVVFIFNPATENQVGFALDPKSAKELAVALVKNADGVLAHQAKKQN